MGQKKKLEKMVVAVQEILGSDVKKKKLKKAKSMRSFVGKMEDKQEELLNELKTDIGADRRELVTRHIDTLEKQIGRGRKILREMEGDGSDQ